MDVLVEKHGELHKKIPKSKNPLELIIWHLYVMVLYIDSELEKKKQKSRTIKAEIT